MQHATRQGDAEIIQALHARIHQLEEMLASVGAGGVSKLIPGVQADSVILSRDLTAAIISIINDSKTEYGDQLAREFWAIERLVEALKEQPTTMQPLYATLQASDEDIQFLKANMQSLVMRSLVPGEPAKPPTDYQVEQLAHRTCWRYLHDRSDEADHIYTFDRNTLLEFARKLREGGAA